MSSRLLENREAVEGREEDSTYNISRTWVPSHLRARVSKCVLETSEELKDDEPEDHNHNCDTIGYIEPPSCQPFHWHERFVGISKKKALSSMQSKNVCAQLKLPT